LQGCVAVVVTSCVFIVIVSLSSFWHGRSGPVIVTIDRMLARSVPRSIRVVGVRVAAWCLEVGNVGGIGSVGCCCGCMVDNLLAIDFCYSRLYVVVSTRGWQGRE